MEFNRRSLALMLFSGLLGLAFLWLPLGVLFNLDRGLDVSDTGHYYVSLYHLVDIRMMSTQFALVWNLIPHPDNILVNRLLVFALLSTSSAALFLIAARAVLREVLAPLQKWLLVTAGIGSAGLYYYYWLPDPSYNAIGVILMALVLAATFSVSQIDDSKGWSFKGAAMLAGFAGLALVATRPVTALALAGLCALLYLVVARHSWTRFWGLILFALLGAALFFVLVQVFIEPLQTTLARIEGGLLKREILGSNQLVAKSFTLLQKEIASVLHTAPWALLLASIGGAISAPGIAERHQQSARIRLVGGALGAAGLAWMQVVFWQQSQALTQFSLDELAYYVFNLGLIAALSCAFAGAMAPHKETRILYWRLASVCILLILTTLSLTVFGTGYWIRKAGIASVFVVLACTLVTLNMARGTGYIWALAMTCALILPMVATRTTMINHPYRLETPLGGQTQKTSIRGERSTLRLDPLTKAFFDRLSTAANEMGPVGQRPILIDLSGRLPMAQYHMQARPAFTPWLLSAYKGSDAFLAHVIAQMSDEALSRAWILDAPGYKNRLNPSPIIERGFNLQNDYRIIGTAFAPYIKTDIVLLAPKSKGAE
ncbi:MAG: hypothetical protein COA84_02970 [Robiginitomaculum sp.]|nr:MAG: hypothetical protein COA84_02970 [Robiginitomaculum sp.]